ncbi:PAS domain-containing hybrid sensor histidine kinase/response regulator [Phascolarctobacterium faecium]|jgi:PAS domain S-box-containing protein|uniref:PAS domain-containing hybrid sensor histidine kinase/response regulator n=1 Tax=Phascolarctobacterium faecium TaxID=33025 RepID=UPI002673FC12|nr:PAS domain-containing protein [Phascolarctobacterium faecium]
MKRFDKKLNAQDIINAIPGGVAIYKVSDIFETVYYSDGVPALSGYSRDEYDLLIKQDAADLIYQEDAAMVIRKIRQVLEAGKSASFEFRKQHRDGHIVWVNVHARKIGEDGGHPLLQCVFHNISAFKQAREELAHVINSIPGGIAAYDFNDMQNPRRLFCSDGVAKLFGCSDAADLQHYAANPWSMVFKEDYQRVYDAFQHMFISSDTLDLSYRITRKDQVLEWVHLNGKAINGIFYAVFTGMSDEAKLFQQISNEAAQGIYVIDKKNHDLLYYNENVELFLTGKNNAWGKKCYTALHDKQTPCTFCPLSMIKNIEKPQELTFANGKSYEIRAKELEWNGLPAYTLFINDITDKITSSRKTEQLEQFYQTLVQNLPGGIAVIRFDMAKKQMLPEYISEGFAAMTGMSTDEAYALYKNDATAGVHPDDLDYIIGRLNQHLKKHLDTCESIYRLRKKDGSYIWIKNNSSLILSPNEIPLIYAVYSDITKEIEAQNKLRQKYNDLLLRQQNYPLSNEILSGYCDITANRILRIYDKTGIDPLQKFGFERQNFFKGLATLIESPEERQHFLNTFLNAPLLEKFAQGINSQELECFIRMPHDNSGHYLKCVINMIESPDNGHTIGVLSVLDLTQFKINDQISMHLAHAHYDFIATCDFNSDSYQLFFTNSKANLMPPEQGSYSKNIVAFLQTFTVPKDREFCMEMFDPANMQRRLYHENSYSFHYSLKDEQGHIYTKNMIVFLIDQRLNKVGMARADITDYVREQRALLNTLAYTFEQLSIINLVTKEFTMYTRKSVLQNLSPYKCADFNRALHKLSLPYTKLAADETAAEKFSLPVILSRLAEKPQGYEFTLPYLANDGSEKNKQINVLWGDEGHHTICLVRCDVTDIISAEKNSRSVLQNALDLAQEANRAKTDFLSAMSHDIRTPMNAIIGMTDLALDDLDNRQHLSEYLDIIKSSSSHLLTLINDILDMSRIEKGKLKLARTSFNLSVEIDRFCSRYQLLMDKNSLNFLHNTELLHCNCIGDTAQLQRIWDNLVSNACKFTPPGGTVTFSACELPSDNERLGWYKFTISDTGIGIDSESLQHLFDPFFRSSDVISKHIEGSGLGLAIVKNIVDYKGGTISVTSRQGEGTTFTVTLPLHFDTAAEHPVEKPTHTFGSADFDFSGKSLLLAEDHPINQKVAELILEKTGAAVTIVENGLQCTELFTGSAKGSFDAILMDIQMPIMNGYEAAQAIRSSTHPQSATIPIIAMTANAFAEDIKNALSAGMNAHIAKPIDPQKLYETLAAYIK